MNLRRDKLLRHISPSTQRGIEIGALDRPVCARPEFDVRYVDFTTTAKLRELRANDPTVDLSKLVEVDYVWGDQSLRAAVGPTAVFDYVVASHVIEHVPDLITWFAEIAEILAPGGVVSFVIPDRRYTFDRLRPETRLGEVVDAYLTRRRKPSMQQVFEHYSLHTRIDLEQAWKGVIDDWKLTRVHDDRYALSVCQNAVASGAYVDAHCWVFTPRSFLSLLRSLIEIGLLPFRVLEFSPPVNGEIDFFVTLGRIDPMAADAKKTQLESLPREDQLETARL